MTKEQIKVLAKECMERRNAYDKLCELLEKKLKENIKWQNDVEAQLNDEELQDFYWFMDDQLVGEKIF